MLVLDKLVKSYTNHRAVDDVSLTVNRGDVLAFLGPNGAGKSTTMRMIAGAMLPDAGDAIIDGHSILTSRTRAQARLGYLPEGAPLYSDMTPPQFLTFLARARDIPASKRPELIAKAIHDARIDPVVGKPIAALSKGYRRRVGLAGAILHDPPVLVLDEPMDGLDPIQKQAVRALISEMATQKAIMISTHSLEDVPAMCSRVAVIDHGRIVADTTPKDLAGETRLEDAFLALTMTDGTVGR